MLHLFYNYFAGVPYLCIMFHSIFLEFRTENTHDSYFHQKYYFSLWRQLYSLYYTVIGSRTYENQTTQFTHKLRGIGVVYDSEKSPKIQKVEPPSKPLIAPNLVFESRFERGNLRQARRVWVTFSYHLYSPQSNCLNKHYHHQYLRIFKIVKWCYSSKTY